MRANLGRRTLYMNHNKALQSGMATSILVSSLMIMAADSMAGLVEQKCYGVAKQAMNDCAANGHGCAGQASIDNSPEEWIYVPEGTCTSIVTICAAEKEKARELQNKVLRRVCRRVAQQESGEMGGHLKKR